MHKRIQSAEAYHRVTSYQRNRLTPHSLDWLNQPRLVKGYPPLSRVALDRSIDLPEIGFISLGDGVSGEGGGFSSPADIQQISTLLRLAQDITSVAVHGDKPFYYRSVASAGALYPFEVYLVARHIEGLDPGAYHYDPFDFSLTALRKGYLSPIPPSDKSIPAIFYLSGIFFRSAWKYRSRAYRYVLLDVGHLIENFRLALKALHLPFRIELDFEDDQVSTLLGFDHQKEACLAVIHLYGEDVSENGPAHGTPEDTGNIEPLNDRVRQASIVSHREIEYAPILDIHHAGKTLSVTYDDETTLPIMTKDRAFLWGPVELSVLPNDVNYTKILKERRSKRNFIPASDADDAFKTFVGQLFRHMGKDSDMPEPCRSVVTTGLLIGKGVSVPPGFYVMDPQTKRLGRLKEGLLIEPMAKACLDQMWLKQAAFHLLFLTDLARLDRRWGARSYRYAMMEAGRMGQLAYLAAAAVGWGACGIGAIYDREAAELLTLSSHEALLYLVGVGPLRKRKRGQ